MAVISPLIHGDEGEIESMFALEHALLVRQFEQRRWTEWRTDGKQGQWRLLHLAILAVKNLHSTPDVQSLRAIIRRKKNRIKTLLKTIK